MTQTFHVPALKSTFTSVFSLKVSDIMSTKLAVMFSILLLKKRELIKKQDIYLTKLKVYRYGFHAPFEIVQGFIDNSSVWQN